MGAGSTKETQAAQPAAGGNDVELNKNDNQVDTRISQMKKTSKVKVMMLLIGMMMSLVWMISRSGLGWLCFQRKLCGAAF